jgi:hypothetical protein
MKLNEQQLPTRIKNFLDRYQFHSVKQLRDLLLTAGPMRFWGCGPTMYKHIYQIDGINAQEIQAQYLGRQKIKEALFELEFPNSADLIKKIWRWKFPDFTKKELAELLLNDVGYFFYLRRGYDLSAKSIANLILDSGMNPNDFFNAVLENRKLYTQRAKLSLIDNKLNRIKKHLTLA